MNIAQRTVAAEITGGAATFAWLCRAAALGMGRSLIESVDDIGAPAAIRDKIVAVSKSSAVASSGAAALMSGDSAASGFLTAAARTSVLLSALTGGMILRTPLNERVGSAEGGQVSAIVVGEGLAVPVSRLDVDGQLIEPEKIAALAVLTKSVWRNLTAAGQAFVSRTLQDSVALAADEWLFARLETSGALAITASADDETAVLDALRAALLTTGDRARARLIWAVSPGAAALLSTLSTGRDDLNPYMGALLSLPAVISDGLNGDRIALIDAAAIAGDLERVEIMSSANALLQLADGPTVDSVTPTPTNMVSMFQADSVAVKLTLWLGAISIRDAAASFIDLTSGSGS